MDRVQPACQEEGRCIERRMNSNADADADADTDTDTDADADADTCVPCVV
jgi:hypothetical protein